MGLMTGLAPEARADATVMLEEPYSYDGALAGTGHTAIYLNRVCASTPTVLRRCKEGERGVVISRYTRIAGYDWIAIPLIPYLFAVEKPEDVPLDANAKLVAFLRDQYRRSHLEDLAPDTDTGDTPKGDWIQLIGSSYDRTSYGFQIETTEAQDDALIEWLNSRPNVASYKVVSRNCANFVRDIVNFYYPKAVSHGFITDLEVTAPKHVSKSLIKYSKNHPDLELTRIVFPQVPGTMRRSRPVRGVLESLFRAKKYMVALAAFHPIIAGGVLSTYLVGDRFNPGKNALVFNMNGEPEPPPSANERYTYLKIIEDDMDANPDKEASHDGKFWRQFQENAKFEMDDRGRTILSTSVGDEVVQMGIARDDFIGIDAPVELQRGLLLTRLHQELGRGRAPKVATSQLRDDWHLLQKVNSAEQEEARRHANPGKEQPEQKLEDRAFLLQ